MRVEYTVEAISDLTLIEAYYSARAGFDTAQRLVERIAGTFERLVSRHPRAGRLRDDLEAGVRALPVLPYLVFYIVEAKRVYAIRVLHGSREIKPPLASLLLAV